MFIIRPVSPKSELNARVTIEGDWLKVFFPAKREDFRLLMHKLDYAWNDPYWMRQPTDIDNRLIETACNVLSADYCVAVLEESQQARILAQDYTPEQHRWIKVIVKGDYEGWFSISWHHTEDYYALAKKIGGSRYAKPLLVVPPEQYEQVQDFAQRYSFSFSERANQVAEDARLALTAAVVVSFTEKKPVKSEKLNGKPAKLETPELVEVDSELVDDLV